MSKYFNISGRFVTRTSVVLTAVVVVITLAAGCDDPFVDPYVNEGRYYTIWGFLDATADQQTLRVIPVTRTATAARAPVTEDLDARVFSTEVASGSTVEWSPSVVELDDGTFAHVFTTGARFRPGFHYELEVRRSDGKSARADTWVPDYNAFQSIIPGAVWTDSLGHLRQEVILKGIDSPWNMTAQYLTEGGLTKVTAFIDYGRTGRRTEDGGWVMELDLTADQVPLRQAWRDAFDNGEFHYEEGIDLPFGLQWIGLRITLADDAWDIPDGMIDPEFLSRPDALTNVTNGYGYWGSTTFMEEKWDIPRELSVALGWEF